MSQAGVHSFTASTSDAIGPFRVIVRSCRVSMYIPTFEELSRSTWAIL